MDFGEKREGAIVSDYPVTCGNTENVAVVRSVVRDIDPALRKFQGQTCAKVDATRSSSQLLAADSIKIWHATLLTSSRAAIVIVPCGCFSVYGSRMRVPLRRVEGNHRRSGNDTPFYSRTCFYLHTTFRRLELHSKCTVVILVHFFSTREKFHVNNSDKLLISRYYPWKKNRFQILTDVKIVCSQKSVTINCSP